MLPLKLSVLVFLDLGLFYPSAIFLLFSISPSRWHCYSIIVVLQYYIYRIVYQILSSYYSRLIQQYEVGLKNRIVRRWIPPKPICDSSNRANQFVSVTLKEIYPMLQIYSCGLCIAVVILILEIGYHTNFREKITNVSNLKIFKHIYNKR